MRSIDDGLVVGVDIGGTFTDITVQDASGRVLRAKTPSTPLAPSEAFLTGVGLALHAADGVPGDVRRVRAAARAPDTWQ